MSGHWRWYPKATPWNFTASCQTDFYAPHSGQNHTSAVSSCITSPSHVPSDQLGLGVYSVFFTVPKRNGDWRLVLDLKFINKFIHLQHFYMVSLRSITEVLQPKEFLTSLDLTEVYLHIPIFPRHRKFLRFCVGNIHLQFKALPFSLCMVPRVFTKILVNPFAYLRQQGIHIHPYLDDLLIHPSSLSQAQQDMEVAIQCLRDHGFLINLEKSQLVPSQCIQHLGMILDTQSLKIPDSGVAIPNSGMDMKDQTSDRVSDGRSHSRLMPLTKLLGLLIANIPGPYSSS